jgi:hypothetical protein
METLNAHAPTTLTKDASSLFIRPPPPSVDGSGVLHVVEVFSSLRVWSTCAWIPEINIVYVLGGSNKEYGVLLKL